MELSLPATNIEELSHPQLGVRILLFIAQTSTVDPNTYIYVGLHTEMGNNKCTIHKFPVFGAI